MNQYTFGNSPAAVNLTKILDEIGCKKLRNLVSKKWSNYCIGMKELKKIRRKRAALESAWTNLFLKEIDVSSLPKHVNSHFCNIIRKKFREAYRDSSKIDEKA